MNRYFTLSRLLTSPVRKLLYFLIGLCLMSLSVYLTRETLGRYSATFDPLWRGLNGYTALFARHWYDLGLGEIGPTLLMESASTIDLAKAQRYVSFPFGFVVPLYIYSKVLHTVPTVATAAYLAKFISLMGALAALGLASRITKESGSGFPRKQVLVSVFVSALFSLPSLLWGQILFSDTLSPWVAFIFLYFAAVYEDSTNNRRLALACLCAATTFGMTTHWTFWALIPIYLVLNYRNDTLSLRCLATSALVGVGLVFWQLGLHRDIFQLIARIESRLGLTSQVVTGHGGWERLAPPFAPWLTVVSQLGMAGGAVLLICSIGTPVYLWYHRKSFGRVARLMPALFLIPFLYFLAVRQHFILHKFAVSHFIPAISVGFFAVVPVIIDATFKIYYPALRIGLAIGLGLVLLPALSMPTLQAREKVLNGEQKEFCELIFREARREDIVFSDQFNFSLKQGPQSDPRHDHSVLFCAHKEVLRGPSPEDIKQYLEEATRTGKLGRILYATSARIAAFPTWALVEIRSTDNFTIFQINPMRLGPR